MLHGYFHEGSRELYLQGRLRLLSLGITVPVDFLVDTGASRTLVSPFALGLSGVDLSQLSWDGGQIAGVGGSLNIREEPCVLAFQEGPKLYLYDVNAGIPDPARSHGIPSLLGRDILERWRMVYDYSRGALSFTVRSADQVRRV